jgi:hypothetical protein
MTASGDQARAHAVVDQLFGPTDPVADRAVDVLHAHAAALAWACEATGSDPAPPSVAARLSETAERLRSGSERADPFVTLHRAALDAVAAHRAASAA